MPVTYTNNWKNIADKLQNIFRTEFGASLPVYLGEGDYAGTQFLKILPLSDNLIEKVVSAELRQYNFTFTLYVMNSSSEQVTLTNLLRLLSRTESLIGNNRTMTLADSTTSINSELTSYEIEAGGDNYAFAVDMDYICSHLGNVS